MYPQITITAQIDNFSQEEFTFKIFDGFTVILDEYQYMVRPSNRHSYKLTELWRRIPAKDNKGHIVIPNPPTLTDGIKQEVINEIVRKVNFKTWEEYRK